MKYLNLIALTLSVLWLISNFDYEPAISTISLLVGLLSQNEVIKMKSPFKKNELSIFLLILAVALFAYSLFNKSTIIGIQGNKNSNNNINIQK